VKKYMVFVYGTLRKHQSNHHLLSNAPCLASQCWTVGKLIDSENGYPYLVPSASGRVYGELYLVDQLQLKALDTLEGYNGINQNNYYDRSKQHIYTDSESYEAFVYIFLNEKLTSNLKLIKNGDWSVNQLLKQKQSLFYFAYGSCMDDERFKLAGVNHYFQKVIGRGVLDHYQLRFTRRAHDGGRADIVEEVGTVEGKVYEIPQEALSYLYRREGVNAGCYRPAVIDINVNGCPLTNILTFVVVDKEPETAPPIHYIEEILRGGNGFLSADYMKKLRKQLKECFNFNDLKK
jgi:gamma-glutamylcyclotransferase (GGCT)/AIG2-like uncharacterized protein YtfP